MPAAQHQATIERIDAITYRVLYAGEVLVENAKRPESEACCALLALDVTSRIHFQLKGCVSGLTMDIEAVAKRAESDVPDGGRGAQLDTYSSIAEAEADRAQQQGTARYAGTSATHGPSRASTAQYTPGGTARAGCFTSPAALPAIGRQQRRGSTSAT